MTPLIPGLNPKCFKLIEFCSSKQQPSTEEINTVSLDRLAGLIKRVARLAPSAEKEKEIEKAIMKHIGVNSTYTHKKDLMEQLLAIAQRLEQDNSSSEPAFLHKLIEDITSCTAGFHNRVIQVVSSFEKPSNFDQLLQVVRESLVADTCSALLKGVSVSVSEEVHIKSQIHNYAHERNYGVRAMNVSDPYANKLPSEDIEKALLNTFMQRFTQYHMITLMEPFLHTLIAEYYRGRSTDVSYVVDDVNCIRDILSRYIPQETISFLVEDYEEDGLTLSRIVDVDWSKIRTGLFNKLHSDGYFEEPIAPRTFLDLMAYCSINPGTEESASKDLVASLSDDESFSQSVLLPHVYSCASPLLSQAILLSASIGERIITRFPDLLQLPNAEAASIISLLLKLTELTESLQAMLIKHLGKTNNDKQTVLHVLAECAPKSFSQLLHLAKDNKELQKVLIEHLGSEGDDKQQTVLHILAMYVPESLLQLLHLTKGNEELQKVLILHLGSEDKYNWTVLHLLARNAPESFLQLLHLAKENDKLQGVFQHFGKATTGNWTVLHVLARYAPESFLQLLDLAEGNEALKQVILSQSFNQDSSGWTLFHLLSRYGEKRTLDKFIVFVCSSDEGINALLGNLNLAIKAYQDIEPLNASPDAPKTIREFFCKYNGITMPQGESQLRVFLNSYCSTNREQFSHQCPSTFFHGSRSNAHLDASYRVLSKIL